MSASSFAANMSVKQNALDFALGNPQAVDAVEKSFYVDDGLTGADTVEKAIELQRQLQDFFAQGGFLLRKWNSSEPTVLQHITSELRETQCTHLIPCLDEYTKTLGMEWNANRIIFVPFHDITKRVLVSDIAKTFDVLGWFSPAIIKVKILLQQQWELKVDWDDPLPPMIHDA